MKKIDSALIVLGCILSTFTYAETIPSVYVNIIGKDIWFAPHLGCFNKVIGEDADHNPLHFFPTEPVRLTIASYRASDGFGSFLLTDSQNFSGYASAIEVLNGYRETSNLVPSIFFKNCFFPDDPSAIAVKVKEYDSTGFDAYGRQDQARKQQEIERILEEDVQAAKRRETWRQEAEARTALKAKPGARLGMTMKQVTENTSWGQPRSINRTTTSTGVDEQWVYGAQSYLYFRNGKLYAIQN